VIVSGLAYLLGVAPKQFAIPGFEWIGRRLQSWRKFLGTHKRFSLYFTLVSALLLAVSLAPLMVRQWPRVTGWGLQERKNHPGLASWLLFGFAICTAFALFELRKKKIKYYAFLEILVGVGVLAVTSFNGGDAAMAMFAKMTGAIYAIIRGLVNMTEALKKDLMTYYYSYKDQKGEWRWRLKASNGRILADSGEGYSSEQECLDDIKRVKGSADAPVKKE
jgi:uncharacterized protein YegP (UPF0339 family)